MRLVVIESPYAGDIETNVKYARACMRDCLFRSEAPYASHLLYTQEGVLNDNIPEQRECGILAGFAYKSLPEMLTVFYTDLGYSRGMELALEYCKKNNMPYEERTLKGFNLQRGEKNE